MLADAKAKATEGRAVYVIAANEAERRRMQQLVQDAPNLGIKFETPASLGKFDWRSLRLSGAHPNCVVLVDHFAIEQQFAAVLEMLHRYDP